MSSAAASAGALACALTGPRDAGPARALTTVGAIGEVSTMMLIERHVGDLAGP